MARVILGVGAGIAAYKACELLRLFKESGHSVRVVPTEDDTSRHAWSGASRDQPSVASTLSSRSLISRSEMDSGFSWLRVSTSGPTYSSSPSPSWE